MGEQVVLDAKILRARRELRQQAWGHLSKQVKPAPIKFLHGNTQYVLVPLFKKGEDELIDLHATPIPTAEQAFIFMEKEARQ